MERMYKLKQNVIYPGGGFLTEDSKTESEWQNIFGFQGSIADLDEWFTPLSVPEEPKDALSIIIDDVFARKRLQSYTYKEAARLVAKKYVDFLDMKKELHAENGEKDSNS